MDGVLLDGHKGKLWFCRRKDGHALGLRVRVSVDGGFEDFLLLFGEAVAVENLSQARVKTRLSGTAYEIECEICGSRRTWWNDRPALSALSALYGQGDPHPALPQLGKSAQIGGGKEEGV